MNDERNILKTLYKNDMNLNPMYVILYKLFNYERFKTYPLK